MDQKSSGSEPVGMIPLLITNKTTFVKNNIYVILTMFDWIVVQI